MDLNMMLISIRPLDYSEIPSPSGNCTSCQRNLETVSYLLLGLGFGGRDRFGITIIAVSIILTITIVLLI